jgi:catechol 2,3-dioxygenase-like lactoylglutathione lyase family enzyme
MTGPIVNIRGLRHLALRVRNLPRSVAFYTEVFGFRITWQPDAQNAYLSSGDDNLALHQDAARGEPSPTEALEHLGVIVDSAEAVDAAAVGLAAHRIPIVRQPRRHRDGSYSCYCADPDGNVIQILHVP